MKYCTKCGKQLLDEAVICPGCGCMTEQKPQVKTDGLLTKLSQRVKTNGIIWIVIAALQILMGQWFVLLVGVLNIISAIKDINYSKTVLEEPGDVVERFEPLTGPIITLAYNLLIGGLIGVIGSIYYFVALRGFVMENKDAFQQMKGLPTQPVSYAASAQGYAPATAKPSSSATSAPVTGSSQVAQKVSCPACGKTQFSGRSNCFHCGAPLNKN